MAQYYAEIKGNRGQASRMGTKKTGIWGHIRGWSVGARVEVYYDKKKDRDMVKVYKTSGSNGGGSDKLIAKFSDRPKQHATPSLVCYKSSERGGVYDNEPSNSRVGTKARA